jgi:hypothetical protein
MTDAVRAYQTFPTLLLHARGEVFFGGVVEPQPQRLRRLLVTATRGELSPSGVDAGFALLAKRLAAGAGQLDH